MPRPSLRIVRPVHPSSARQPPRAPARPPDLEVTRLPNATIYYAADLGIRTAEVVRKGDRWETRCYYGPGEYDLTRPTQRETAERAALAHSFALMR